MRVKEFQAQQDFVNASIEALIEVFDVKEGVVNVGIPGGKTPLPIYRELEKRKGIDFSRTQFFLVDERYVPYKFAESNIGTIQKVWSENIHTFDTLVTIEESLGKYTQELPTEPFDLIFLGVGTDGHVASLFPHSDALGSQERVAYTTTDTLAVRDRLTMTFVPIMNAKKVILLVSGEEKRGVIEELQNGSKSVDEFPAKRLLEHDSFEVLYQGSVNSAVDAL